MGCVHTLQRSKARRRHLHIQSGTQGKDLTHGALELASPELHRESCGGERAARGAGAGALLQRRPRPPGSQAGRPTSPSSKEGWPFDSFPSFSELDGALRMD